MAGCCGCTLQTSAIVAAVFGMIQSVAGFITGIAVLANYFSYRYSVANIITNVLVSATVFNAVWLIATIVLIIGIVKENAVMHRVWVGVTSMIMIVDLVHTIVYLVGFVESLNYAISVRSSSSYYSYTYIDFTQILLVGLLMTAVSRGSVLLWIVNICLTIYTAHRANEIERGPVPQTGQTVFVYGNQPVHSYPGQTVVVQHGGPSTGMAYNYPQQQYVQPPAYPPAQDQGLPEKQ